MSSGVVPPPGAAPASGARPVARPTTSVPAVAPPGATPARPPSGSNPVRPPAPPAGALQPPPPPPAALQPPPPPGAPRPPGVPAVAPVAPSIAPLVPSVAPMVPAIAPAGTPVRPPSGASPAVPPPPPAAVQPPPPPPPSAGKDLDPTQLAELWERCSKLDQQDYFEVLMVERTASPADIKKAFYRESRTYHPDRFFHLSNKELKDRVNELYKRVTEAYYVLRDDAKRRQYTANISGPERAQKLRFTESSEAETRAASKRQVEEQIGTHPKGRQFYQTGAADADAGRWSSAERNLKMALTYEPANTRYKEKLAEVQKVLLEEARKQGDAFKIR
ncbi:DnaJ domain-containing protein [Archangium violaceum]|nr:DnaJ domain-containing protein [Archangium violaceum]